MTIKVGDRLPNATFRIVTEDGPRPVTTQEFFAGKTIVLFGLPGAFTPTCHKNHLPGFITNSDAFKAKGVAEIAMTSVNDQFVLSAWSTATGAGGHVTFLADGSADFAKAAGLNFDASANGLGVRSLPLFDAGRGRRREAAQHRRVAGQGRPFQRGASARADVRTSSPSLRDAQRRSNLAFRLALLDCFVNARIDDRGSDSTHHALRGAPDCTAVQSGGEPFRTCKCSYVVPGFRCRKIPASSTNRLGANS